MAILLVMLVVIILSGKAQDSVVDLRDVVFETGLRAPSSLVHVDDSFTHIAMILTNIAGKPKRENKILIEFNKKSDGLTTLHVKFKNMLESIFLHSSGTPIHYIFMTDQESMPIIKKVLKAEIGKHLSEMEELVHLLPCQFNRQIQAVINNEVSCYPIDEEMVEEYHKCEEKSSILHLIGD